jgi:hypothetical protein
MSMTFIEGYKKVAQISCLIYLEKYMKERKRERAKIYDRLHCTEVMYLTILHRPLFIKKQ